MTIKIHYDKDANVWVGYCPELNVYSQGRTLEEAEKATRSAIRLLREAYLETSKEK